MAILDVKHMKSLKKVFIIFTGISEAHFLQVYLLIWPKHTH